MRTGPEHAAGWRARFESPAGEVLVEARHHPRSRMPNGNEMVRQMARGRPVEMVRTIDHEWSMRLPSGQRTVLRQHANGRFHTPAIHAVFDDVGEAARRWGEAVARSASRPAPPEDDVPGPGAP